MHPHRPPQLTWIEYDREAPPVQSQRLGRLIRTKLAFRYLRRERVHRIPLKAFTRRVAREQLRQRLVDTPPENLRREQHRLANLRDTRPRCTHTHRGLVIASQLLRDHTLHPHVQQAQRRQHAVGL